MSLAQDLAQDPVLAEIVRRLVELLDPERIYLFGSRARGDTGPDSDYDLMVVVPQLTEPGYRLAQRAHGVLWGLGAAADILARNPRPAARPRRRHSAGGKSPAVTHAGVGRSPGRTRRRATTGRWSEAMRARRLRWTWNSSPSSSVSQ